MINLRGVLHLPLPSRNLPEGCVIAGAGLFVRMPPMQAYVPQPRVVMRLLPLVVTHVVLPPVHITTAFPPAGILPPHAPPPPHAPQSTQRPLPSDLEDRKRRADAGMRSNLWCVFHSTPRVTATRLEDMPVGCHAIFGRDGRPLHAYLVGAVLVVGGQRTRLEDWAISVTRWGLNMRLRNGGATILWKSDGM